MPVLLPFECGAALPGLSAEASPNEASVSGRMLGSELPGGNYQSRGLPGLSVYLNHRMTQSHPAVVHHWLV